MEKDPNGKSPHEGGAKLDDGKCLASSGLIEYFPNALRAVAEVSTFGAKKYTLGGWKTVPDGQKRYRDAKVRHQLKRATGESLDQDSGLLHLSHEAWNVLAELELCLSKKSEKPTPLTSRHDPLSSCEKPVPGGIVRTEAPKSSAWRGLSLPTLGFPSGCLLGIVIAWSLYFAILALAG